jgi:hypothetical protein
VERTAVPSRNPQVVHRAVGEGEVLLHLDTGAYHSVTAVGALVWELVDGERTVAAIVDGVRAGVERAPAELEAEVDAFLVALRDRDLLQV